MALRALQLRRSITLKNRTLEELRARDPEFATREAELEAAINEASTQEDQDAVASEIEQFEADKQAHENSKSAIQGEIAQLEHDLEEEEKKQPAPAAKKPGEERNDNTTMNIRDKFFKMSNQERDAFFADQQVKDFLANVRTCIREKRALTNAGLTIPQVSIGLLKQITMENSKLMSRVNLRSVSGKARQRIMGEIPEGIWTEACAALNELTLLFNDVEVDGYKVGGFFAVCNAILEDNDVNLMSEILTALGRANGKAVDKAIVYGTGVKMPLGIVPRLAQTVKPDNYKQTYREWKDLHISNIITGSGATGLKLFQELARTSKVAINDYYDNGLTWMMNRSTHMDLTAESMEKNMNAAIVAGINSSMPVTSGDIVDLPFIPDGDIVFGYLDAYLLAERAGTALGQSEHCRFIEDQTVFRGTGRYDGLPVIAEAFGVINISGKAPTTSVPFPQDKANNHG